MNQLAMSIIIVASVMMLLVLCVRVAAKHPKMVAGHVFNFLIRVDSVRSPLAIYLVSFVGFVLTIIVLLVGFTGLAITHSYMACKKFILKYHRAVLRYLPPVLLVLFVLSDISPYYPVAWKVSQYGGFERIVQETTDFDRSVIECDRQFGTEAYQLCLLDNARALAKADSVQPATAILIAHAIALSIKHPGPLNAELKSTGKQVIAAGMRYLQRHQTAYTLANEIEDARRRSVLLRAMTLTDWDLGSQMRNQLSWEYLLLDSPELTDWKAFMGGANG